MLFDRWHLPLFNDNADNVLQLPRFHESISSRKEQKETSMTVRRRLCIFVAAIFLMLRGRLHNTRPIKDVFDHNYLENRGNHLQDESKYNTFQQQQSNSEQTNNRQFLGLLPNSVLIFTSMASSFNIIILILKKIIKKNKFTFPTRHCDHIIDEKTRGRA